MKTILAVASLIIAMALVVADLALAFVAARKANNATVEELTSFPGSETIKALADKAPRLAAALAFMILAGIFSEVLKFTAAAATT